MVFWGMMLFFSLLIPGLMVLFGFLWKKHPPKDINGVYGYRTSMSCKNQETWDYAHRAAGRIWRRWGLGTFVISAAGYGMGSLAIVGWDAALLGTAECVDAISWLSLGLEAVQLVVLTGSIIPVERALKRAFDQEGNRKL